MDNARSLLDAYLSLCWRFRWFHLDPTKPSFCHIVRPKRPAVFEAWENCKEKNPWATTIEVMLIIYLFAIAPAHTPSLECCIGMLCIHNCIFCFPFHWDESLHWPIVDFNEMRNLVSNRQRTTLHHVRATSTTQISVEQNDSNGIFHSIFYANCTPHIHFRFEETFSSIF